MKLLIQSVILLCVCCTQMYAQPYTQTFDQVRDPSRVQQKFFPRSDAYLTFRQALTPTLRKKIQALLPQAIKMSQASFYNIYAIYRYLDVQKKNQSPIQKLGWIYIDHYQTPQGVLRVVWAFDMDLQIKGYEILQCRIANCDLLHSAKFISFMEGHTISQLKSYLSLSADHLIKPLPKLELSAQAIGLSLIHSAVVSIQSILVIWPQLFTHMQDDLSENRSQ